MLSEMRAYGQGVLVAEQIPSKLAPDVLKNTNLKIVHRLIAQDDRLSIGQTMNLNEVQQLHLGTLRAGMAAVYAEGADHAYLVRMENYKRKISALVDSQLKKLSRGYASVKPFQMIMDLDQYDVSLSSFGGPDPTSYHAAGKLLDTEQSKWLWSTAMLFLISAPYKLFNLLDHFTKHVEAEMPRLSAEQHDTIMRMFIVRGCSELLQARGAQLGWSYTQVEDLRVLLTKGLLTLLQAYHYMNKSRFTQQTDDFSQTIQDTVLKASEIFNQFLGIYTTITQKRQGPFIGCMYCPAKCLYRSEVNNLLSPKDQQWINDEITNSAYQTVTDRFEAITRAIISIVQSWSGEDGTTQPDINTLGIGYCAALHTTAKSAFSEYEQATISTNLWQLLFNSK
jgi:hypothetical protein